MILYSIPSIINDIPFNNLSLNASNIEPKNVDILSLLAKKPSIASVKKSIIVIKAHTLGPWYTYINGNAKAPNNLVVVIRFTNTSSIIFNALYFISIILWNIILFVNAKILCYNYVHMGMHWFDGIMFG